MGSCISKPTESSNPQPTKINKETSNQIPHLKLHKHASSIKVYAHKTEKMLCISQTNSNATQTPKQQSLVDASNTPKTTVTPNTSVTPYTPNTAITLSPVSPSPISPSPVSPISPIPSITPIQENVSQILSTDLNVIHSEHTDSQQSKPVGLYEIFTLHAINGNKHKMDINGLTEALTIFGMTINKNKNLQKLIWSKFDLDNENEIDYNDFVATLSSLVGTTNEDSLFLMFQIFDVNESGYLRTNELSDMLFSQKHIGMVVTKQYIENSVAINNIKQQCLKNAENMIAKSKNNGKISCNEYFDMMVNHHVATPICGV